MNLAPNHPIDLPVLLETRLLVQAGSGGGKSWALRRLLEQTAPNVQQLVIDPEGEFATMREKFDYVIAAARDGDALASPQTAALLARRLMESGVSAILDIYDLKAYERQQFVRRFLDALVNLPRKLWHPVMVVLDEAHVYCPQVGSAESASAVIDIATRGRKRGLCPVLATQRLSKLHKDAAAEMQNKLIGLTGLDVDVKRAADELGMAQRDARQILRALHPGEFYAFGPALTRAPERITVGPVSTTHPKAGQRLLQAPPPASPTLKAQLAKLADLQKDAESEARTVEDLTARNAKLKRDLAASEKRVQQGIPPEVDGMAACMVMVRDECIKAGVFPKSLAPLFYPEAIIALHAKATAHTALDARSIEKAWRELQNQVGAAYKHAKAITDVLATTPALPYISFNEIPKGAVDPRARATDARGEAMQSPTPQSFAGLNKREEVEEVIAKPGTLPTGERAILTACAQYQPNGCTREQLSILTGYKRSTRDAYIRRLREKTFVDMDGAQVVATEAGVAALGADFQPLPTGAALREHWLQRLPRGEAALLQILCDSYPQDVSRDHLSEATSFARSSRDAYLQRLRARQLVKTEHGSAKAAAVLFD